MKNNMIAMDPDRRKFEESLPFYVNKTLDTAEMEWMEAYLLKFPELKGQVTLLNCVQQALQNDSDVYDSEAAWEKLLIKYKQLHAKPSLLNQIKNRFAQWGMTPAFGLAFTLLVIQSGYLLQLHSQNQDSNFRGQEMALPLKPHLKVTVSANTDYAMLVSLLRKNGCKIVAGPSETGDIWVYLDEPANATKIKADLLSSGLIDEVVSVSDGQVTP